MPEDDEYKNSSESNENRSEEPQSDLNNKGFEQYVNEDGSKDSILDNDYFQDSESIPQENFIVKPKSTDLNKDVSSDTHSTSDQIKDTSGEQVTNTDDYYQFESDDHSENTSGLNENVGESEQDYSSSQESSSQVSSQTPITYSASSSKNVSQQSSEKSSNKSPINEQSASTSALNSTEQESSSSGPLKSEGKSSTPIKSENTSSGPLKSEGESSSPIKSESTSSSPLKSKSASSDSVLKDQETSSRGLRKSANTGDLKKSKSSILQNKDKNKDKGKKDKDKKDKNKDKDKDSKKNNTSMAKALNVASSISNVLKVDDEQNAAENLLNNSAKELISVGKRMTKSQLKKFALNLLMKNGVSKSVAKKAVIKFLNSTKAGIIISAPVQAIATTKNVFSGNVGDTFKDAAMSLASGDPVPLIITAVVIGIVILFGLSLIGSSFSENSKVNPTNYVEDIEVGESSGSEVLDDDEDEENPFNATAMINFNNTFSNLNDYFYKYSDDSNNMLSNSLKKSDQSIDLMKQLTKKLVQTRQFKYSIFDDYFIKYFFDEVTEKELKDKVKSDIKSSGMLFTETYIGKAIQTNKLYNSFKKDLDDYKTKINQIKTNTEKVEGEDENTFKNKVINEFKTQNPNVDSIYLTCYKLFSDSVDNLKIVKNIDMNLENRWENTRELTGLLYFIKNINDVDENRNLNIEANDLENILKSLEDEMTDLNVSIIGKNLSGEDLDFNYVYGSKRKKTSLYFEKEFLNTCDVKYQEIIDGIGAKEDISAINLSDYKNIMDNTESWSLVRNLQIFEGLINNYNESYIPNDLLLGNNLDEEVGNQDNEDDGSEEDGGEEEIYDFNNCLYKVYSIIQEKMANNFGTSKYNGSEEKKDESIVTSKVTPTSTQVPTPTTEPYERKNNNIFYGIPEIDVTAIDKTFYFPTEMISVELLNTPGVSNSPLGTSSKAMNVVKKDEIIQRVEDLIPLLIGYQDIVKDIQKENKNEISDVEKRISDENASNDFINKGDNGSKYIYEDSEIDDLFAFDDLSTIEIDEEKYYVFDNISELSEIKLDLSSKDFLTWFKNEEDDTSFYNNYIPEAFIFDEDDELEDVEYAGDFAEILKDADEDLKSEMFKEANQQYERLSSDSDYDLSEEYIVFKYLLFGGIQNFEPVLNQVWEENIFNVFGNFTTEKTNLASDDIPFTNSYNDYIDLNMPVGKEIYAICSGKVVEKTDNSITIRSSEQLFDENNYIFYVEYTNLSPNVNVDDEVFRYPVPTEDYFEQDANGNIKDSTIIGKAKTENLQIKCYINDQSMLVNPRLIIQDDDGLPIVPYLPSKSSTEQSFAYPSYKMYTLPPKVETPKITPYLEPPDPLHRKLLFVFGTITYYAGLLYAIWAIIKFALGLHDYESANYQAIWQFIAASVLIFGALLLKYLSGL